MTVRELFEALDDGNQSHAILETSSGETLLWVTCRGDSYAIEDANGALGNNQDEKDAAPIIARWLRLTGREDHLNDLLTLIRVEVARDLRGG